MKGYGIQQPRCKPKRKGECLTFCLRLVSQYCDNIIRRPPRFGWASPYRHGGNIGHLLSRSLHPRYLTDQLAKGV